MGNFVKSFIVTLLIIKSSFAMEGGEEISNTQSTFEKLEIIRPKPRKPLAELEIVKAHQTGNTVKKAVGEMKSKTTLPEGERKSLLDRRVRFHQDLIFSHGAKPDCFAVSFQKGTYILTYQKEGSLRFMIGQQVFNTKEEIMYFLEQLQSLYIVNYYPINSILVQDALTFVKKRRV